MTPQEESIGILLDLARSGEIDPWNIDIIDVTDKFLRKIEEREKIDIRVSARTLLYASILLRMKSDILVNVPPPEDEYMEEPPISATSSPTTSRSSSRGCGTTRPGP